MGCDVNAWSTGLHSYGKTPIFYAITRCRDGIVEVLLERGARTRILNNKGQSVLSLAASHNSPTIVARVEASEAVEERLGGLDSAWQERLARLPEAERPVVRAGGWLDFHTSHPDGVRYGDLDPRFLSAGELDALLAEGGRQTRLSINPTTHESRRLQKHLPGRQRQWIGEPADWTSAGLKGRSGRAASGGAPPLAPPVAPPPSPGAARVGVEDALAAAARTAARAATLDALVTEQMRPLEALLRRGLSLPSPAEVAAATDPIIACLSSQQGPWLQAAAMRISPAALTDAPPAQLRACADSPSQRETRAEGEARAEAQSTLLRDAAAVETVGTSPVHAKLRRRLLLSASRAPSVGQVAEEAARVERASADRKLVEESRRRAAAAAEERRLSRVAALDASGAPPPPSRFTCDVAGLRVVEALVVGATRVGIDTEWADGVRSDGEPSASMGDAVLATVQLAFEDAPCAAIPPTLGWHQHANHVSWHATMLAGHSYICLSVLCLAQPHITPQATRTRPAQVKSSHSAWTRTRTRTWTWTWTRTGLEPPA